MSSMKDLEDFNPDSKIWIFTANRLMTTAEVTQISAKLKDFTKSWVSHNNQLKAGAFILHKIFIVLAVDNSAAMASGCSIDTAMRFIQTIQIDFGIDFLDRQSFVFLDGANQIHHVRKSELGKKVVSGEITDDTLFYDTLVENLGEFKTGLIKPRNSFWMKNIA